MDFLRAGRWDEVLRFLHPALEMEDRRRAPSGRTRGADRLLLAAQTFTSLTLELDRHDVIAVRGDHVVLTRDLLTSDGYDDEWLAVQEVDDSGRMIRQVFFDPDQPADAIAELDRLAARHGTPPPTVRPNRAALLTGVGAALMQEGRWEDFRARLNAEFVHEDRRALATQHIINRDDTIEGSKLITELSLNVGFEALATRGDRLVLARSVVGNGGFTDESLNLTVYDEQDLAIRSIQFAVDQMDAALAELDRMASAEAKLEAAGADLIGFADRKVPLTPNRAVMVNEANLALMAAGRWEELRASAHPDFVMEDRRSVPTEPFLNSDRAVKSAMASDDFALRLTRNEVVATRGQLLALMRQSFDDGGFESGWLALLKIDESGRSVRYVQFDPDDTGPALAELERLADLAQESLEDGASRAFEQLSSPVPEEGVGQDQASG